MGIIFLLLKTSKIIKGSLDILKIHFIFSFIFSLIYYKINRSDRNAFIFPYSSEMQEYGHKYHDFLFLAFNVQSIQGTNEVNIQSKTAQFFVTIQII